MLVLSRKIGEKLNIGDDVVVEIRRVAGNRVTIGVEAPRSIRVVRGELALHDEAAPSAEEAGNG